MCVISGHDVGHAGDEDFEKALLNQRHFEIVVEFLKVINPFRVLQDEARDRMQFGGEGRVEISLARDGNALVILLRVGNLFKEMLILSISLVDADNKFVQRRLLLHRLRLHLVSLAGPIAFWASPKTHLSMVHSHFETFSQTAVLAAVAVSFHDNASSALLARVLQTLVERATKETLAALARVDSVVIARGFIATDAAGNDHFVRFLLPASLYGFDLRRSVIFNGWLLFCPFVLPGRWWG